jgi:hypothetical protein
MYKMRPSGLASAVPCEGELITMAVAGKSELTESLARTGIRAIAPGLRVIESSTASGGGADGPA